MLSLTHILLLGLILMLIFGPTSIPRLGRSFGEGMREYRKALRGEEDIDVTHSVKRIEED